MRAIALPSRLQLARTLFSLRLSPPAAWLQYPATLRVLPGLRGPSPAPRSESDRLLAPRTHEGEPPTAGKSMKPFLHRFCVGSPAKLLQINDLHKKLYRPQSTQH